MKSLQVLPFQMRNRIYFCFLLLDFFVLNKDRELPSHPSFELPENIHPLLKNITFVRRICRGDTIQRYHCCRLKLLTQCLSRRRVWRSLQYLLNHIKASESSGKSCFQVTMTLAEQLCYKGGMLCYPVRPDITLARQTCCG